MDLDPVLDPVEVHINSDPKRIADVRDAGCAFALKLGFSSEQATKIALATDEALVNVIKHGYDGQPGHPIHVRLESVRREGRSGLRILITDEARQVDPSEIRGRDLEDIRPGGLGVYLMRSIMDHVQYRVRDKGMALEMIKFLE